MSTHDTTQTKSCANGQARTWHCGTLVYTKAGLITLFVCLLWGNFCFTLMQQVIPSILPLKLKSLGASNLLIGILLTSAFPILGMFLSPYLSFKSDYLRTRWGRRIPFFACSLPFVCLSILLLAFSDDITHFLHNSILSGLSAGTVGIVVIGICIVAFQFADVLIVSVYQYLFNDTVPVMVIGRFIGLMQVVGGIVGFLYNYFVFKYAESNMKEIFICTSILYCVGIGMVCLFVKEGEYAPVTDQDRQNIQGLAGFKTFFRESFSHKFYWTKFLYAMTPALIWNVISPFNIFFYKEMGLTLDYIGKASAIVSIAGIVSAYFSSIFIDRWHPLRILTYSTVFAIVFTSSNWVWLFVTLPPLSFFWLQMLGAGLIGAFHGILLYLAATPCDIRLQPKSRYGQFCSAQSILANGCNVLAGFGVGLFFDFLKRLFHGSDYAYRFNFVWSGLWILVGAGLICTLYRQWKNLGGDLHFRPPAPWSKSGFEEIEQAPFVGTQVKWLKYSLGLIQVMMGLSFLYLVPLTYWLWHTGWSKEFRWHFLVFIPASLAICFLWKRVKSGIDADVARCKAGEHPRNGIPHHGVFFIKACALLLMFVLCIGKTTAAIHSGLPNGVTIFSLANVINNLLVIGVVMVLCRLERGYDPMLDYDGRKTSAI